YGESRFGNRFYDAHCVRAEAGLGPDLSAHHILAVDMAELYGYSQSGKAFPRFVGFFGPYGFVYPIGPSFF
ncbi:hypothetical protein, partial [Acidithiobacillus ferrooxidans]|uniref:hypothetical protein n=1 Tax=Acidithiobacillus ferrooxidans TaxID=920 RepID=UPI0019415847